jgi:hypothetical protein
MTSDFTVKLTRIILLFLSVILKPDGVFQDYTKDVWKINIDCGLER